MTTLTAPNIPTYMSEHFTVKEALSSAKAAKYNIDNTQHSDEVWAAAIRTATRMEKVRLVLNGSSIYINSWIRCLALNRLLGSKDTSQHIKGEAVDFSSQAYGTPVEICKALVVAKDLIRFDQLILEHTWVHISFCSPLERPRGQVLSLLETGEYAIGLTDKEGNAL
jgi:zinc D-Ala-D-Ala carboxypeptidase